MIVELSSNASPWANRHLTWVLEHLQVNPGDYAGAFAQGLLGPRMLSRLQSMVRRDAGREFAKVLIEIGTSGQVRAREDVRTSSVRSNFVLMVLTLGVVVFFYGGQAWIVYRIQEESAPEKLKLRAQQRALSISVPGVAR